MRSFETNSFLTTLEMRRTDVGKRTLASLAMALSFKNSRLTELNLIDVKLDKSCISALSPGLDYVKLKTLRVTNCGLSSKVYFYFLFLSLSTRHLPFGIGM